MRLAKFYLTEYIEGITFLGSTCFYAILVLFFLSINNYPFSLTLVIGYLLSLMIAIIIRIFYFKERPKKRDFKNIFEKLDASSFPSLHSMRIFVLVILLGSLTNIYTLILYFLIGILVGISRIKLKHHDFLDVSSGFIIGILTGLLTLKIQTVISVFL